MDRRPMKSRALFTSFALVASFAFAASPGHAAIEKIDSPRPEPTEGFVSFGPGLLDGARLLLASLGPSTPLTLQVEDHPRSVRVACPDGQTRIARQYGPAERGMILLPDGQIAWTDQPVYTTEPFLPDSIEVIRDRLLAGPYAGFRCHTTAHYVVVYEGSEAFALASAQLLESLHDGLVSRFKDHGFPVKDSEFPLVAVIYANEARFRAHRELPREVQAYYDAISNRISLYETRDGDHADPQTAAMRRPQTVAHEGTHQILQNIGVQPRLAAWPAWLVEGLAELAASTEAPNAAWAGFSRVNPFHIATLEDLLDAQWMRAVNPDNAPDDDHDWRRSLPDLLFHRQRLTPTDYALAWTLTHYLANQRTEAFVAYLKTLSQRQPGEPHSLDDELALFNKQFPSRPEQLDQDLKIHVNRLRAKVSLAYYAVTFEQTLPGGLVRRGTLVSRSPALIREWIEERMPDPRGGQYQWQAMPFRERRVAFQYVEEWLRSR